MITLTCTKCRATLTIDDAFAGGVCRCQHCGTIQTVPKIRDTGGPSSGAVAQAAQGGSKTLYQGTRPSTVKPTPGSGLDELGEIIASSGLSSSRLRQPTKTPPEAKDAKPRKLPVSPAVAGGIAAGVLVLIVAIVLLTRGGDDADDASSPTRAPVAANTDGGTARTQPVTAGPNFAGVGLRGDTVVYVLDRGDATREMFSDLKESTFRSLASLGPDKQFQIVFWDNGSVAASPATGPLPATPANIATARKQLDEIYAFGQTDAQPALQKALAAKPSDVVLATASTKAAQLDDQFVQMIRNVTSGNSVRIHTVSIGGKDATGPMQAIAREFNGQFRALTVSELRSSR